jgi:hypothetical protein
VRIGYIVGIHERYLAVRRMVSEIGDRLQATPGDLFVENLAKKIVVFTD